MKVICCQVFKCRHPICFNLLEASDIAVTIYHTNYNSWICQAQYTNVYAGRSVSTYTPIILLYEQVWIYLNDLKDHIRIRFCTSYDYLQKKSSAGKKSKVNMCLTCIWVGDF